MGNHPFSLFPQETTPLKSGYGSMWFLIGYILIFFIEFVNIFFIVTGKYMK